MSDQGCIESMDITRGRDEVVGVTPIDAQTFKTRYEQDTNYQNHIATLWGERAYDTRPSVAIDSKTRFGIDNGWGMMCSGQQNWRGHSRHNGKTKRGVNCCSKFSNGQMAFNLDSGFGPANGKNEDCGFGWTGRAVAIPDFQNQLQLIRHIDPPAWMDNFLALNAKQIQNTDINLVSGQEFSDMSVIDQLNNLIDIHYKLCYTLIPRYYGADTEYLTPSCTACSTKISEFITRIHTYEIQQQECMVIINQIFRLYLKIHELADVINRKQSINTIRRAITKSTKSFLDLCNMTEELSLLGGKKSRRKKRKTKRVRKSHKNNNSKKSRKSHRRK
jgi:hypothetical protein